MKNLSSSKRSINLVIILCTLICYALDHQVAISSIGILAEASLISNPEFQFQQFELNNVEQPKLIFDTSRGAIASLESNLVQVEQPKQTVVFHIPPSVLSATGDEFLKNNDYVLGSATELSYDHDSKALEKQLERKALAEILASTNVQPSNHKYSPVGGVASLLQATSPIRSNVVDFELASSGGHNKAKIMKKNKKKKEEEFSKKWGKKKMTEKKALDLEHKEHMKKKKVEGSKGKKKWSKEEQGMKKKDKLKKKKWGKKLKKGKGLKKGSKGKKFLKDVGHKDTGFKTVYHKEEYGHSRKWHDVKRQKKWDDKDKKWKKKWNKENGKKYKGDHMKNIEKKEGAGKKYKKVKEEKFKKEKKEKLEKGKKMKMEQLGKKKEEGSKKEMKEMKKKKKKSMKMKIY